jgi:lysophospholipase L1-like esterase
VLAVRAAAEYTAPVGPFSFGDITMRFWRVPLLVVGVSTLLVGPARPAEPARFPLRDGDSWVMAGDSITAQHLHSNYFEAFCYARYPKLTFRFRNSGVGGDTVPRVLARFDWDVAAWKPTVVSVELGMNDQGSATPEQFIANMAQLDAKIKSIGARPVYFTSSPVNSGETINQGRNAKLHQFALALKEFAQKEHAPFADQFHPVLQVWNRNKPLEKLADALTVLKGVARDDAVAGVEHLRAFLDAQAKQPVAAVSMQGDPVHPGPPGQLIMAAELLKALGAEPFVSSVTLDAHGKVAEAKGCRVEGAKAEGGKITFDRLDEALPFPIPDEARGVLLIDPTVLELSQYTLKVTGAAGPHRLSVDGTDVGVIGADLLGRGVNLTTFVKGPIAEQGRQVLAAVAAKEGLVGQWRRASRSAAAPGAPADARDKLNDLTKQVEEADAKIREAAKPRKLHFELEPVK